MRVLIIHHLEPEWSEYYMALGNVTFDALCERTAMHINEGKYDRVILTQFRYDERMQAYPYDHIRHLVDDVHEYGFGLDLDCFGFDAETKSAIQEKLERGELHEVYPGNFIANGTWHCPVVPIDSWMVKLKEQNADVSLCGAFDGVCLSDMYCALSAIGIKFTRIESLIL